MSSGSPEQRRYRRSTRRTAAEPLAASWHPSPRSAPDPDDQRPPRRRDRKSGSGSFLSTYGWRVYALPLLIVLTVLAVVSVNEPAENQAKTGAPASDQPGPSGAAAAPTPEPPVVIGEAPQGKADLNLPSAALPETAEPYTETGPSEWHVLRGTKGPFGTAGRVYKYTVEVENGIDLSRSGGEDSFAQAVDGILENPRGWTNGGRLRMQRVDSDNEKIDFRVSLTTPASSKSVCGYLIKYESSCWNSDKKRVFINLARWVRGAVAFDRDLGLYRQYAITHEVGHALGKQHEGCATNGGLAPVMMQQSFGVENNVVWELNQVDPGNKNKVQKDGKVCRPNPWPYQ